MTTSKKLCPVGKALDELSPEDRQEIEAILANGISSVVISKWFTDVRRLPGCTTTAVNAHRRDTCGCP